MRKIKGHKMDFQKIKQIAQLRAHTKIFEDKTIKETGASRQADEATAKRILEALGLDCDKILLKIGEIESELYDDVRDDETRFELIDKACADLRYILTNVIGE